MTASVFEEDREACLAAGMSDFIAKPIELENIEAVLSRVRSHGATEGPRARERA